MCKHGGTYEIRCYAEGVVYVCCSECHEVVRKI